MNASTAPINANLLRDIREAILLARKTVTRATNLTLIATYWQIGEHIRRAASRHGVEQDAEALVKELAVRLHAEFGTGFDRASLRDMLLLSGTFAGWETARPLCSQLGWVHFRIMLRERAVLATKTGQPNHLLKTLLKGCDLTSAMVFADPAALSVLGLQHTPDATAVLTAHSARARSSRCLAN